jgi:hypothetical protein
VLIYSLLKKGVVCPYCEDYFSFDSKKVSICDEKNYTALGYMTKIGIII